MKVYDITPTTKPRMTQRDRWKKRECVVRYHAFKDRVRFAKLVLPEQGYHVVFVIPMPKSWSKSKRQAMCGQPHQQKPDKDNLEKALLDALYQDDCHVWDGRVSKVWGNTGRIIVLEAGGFDVSELERLVA